MGLENEGYEKYKRKKKEAKQRFSAMQSLPHDVKVRRAELRAREFIDEMDKRGCNAHVSVGGFPGGSDESGGFHGG